MATNDTNTDPNHPPLDQAQDAQIAAVTAWYEKEILLPSKVAFNGATYQCDPQSWDALSKIISIGSLPTNFYWVDADNNKVSFSMSDLQALGGVMSRERFTVFNRLQTRKSEIRAATTEDELLSVVVKQVTEKGNL
jgi:hypothetical protein